MSHTNVDFRIGKRRQGKEGKLTETNTLNWLPLPFPLGKMSSCHFNTCPQTKVYKSGSDMEEVLKSEFAHFNHQDGPGSQGMWEGVKILLAPSFSYASCSLIPPSPRASSIFTNVFELVIFLIIVNSSLVLSAILKLNYHHLHLICMTVIPNNWILLGHRGGIRKGSAIVNVFDLLGKNISIITQAFWKLHLSPGFLSGLGNSGREKQETSFIIRVTLIEIRERLTHESSYHHHWEFRGQARWGRPV